VVLDVIKSEEVGVTRSVIFAVTVSSNYSFCDNNSSTRLIARP